MRKQSTKRKSRRSQPADAHPTSPPTKHLSEFTFITNPSHFPQPPSQDALHRTPPPIPKPYSQCRGEITSHRHPPGRRSIKLPPVPPAPYGTHGDHIAPLSPTSNKPCHYESQTRPSHQLQQSLTEVEDSTNPQSFMRSKSPLTTFDSDKYQRITLPDLMSKYSFPLHVQVVKGFVGKRGEEGAIASGEVYNIHFIKHTKVVRTIDCHGNTYNVPLNSAARFGIIYRSRRSASLHEPEQFETAGDIMSASPLPRVVCAKRSCIGHDSASSVEKKEVLVIQGIHNRKLGFNLLKVMCVGEQQQRMLSKDCTGQFTTDPYRTQMYLPDILSNVPRPLPLMANMYADIESEHTLPECLNSEAVILAEEATETSLVATLMNDDSDPTTGSVPNTLVDLPTSLDIEVQVVSPGAAEKDKLHDNTQDLYTRFDPSMLETCLDAASDEEYAAQSYLLASIRKGHEMDGLHLEIPKHQQLAQSTVDAQGDENAVQVDDPPSPPPTPSLATVPGIPSLNSQVKSLAPEASQDHSRSSLPQAEISRTEHNDSSDGVQSKAERQILTPLQQCNTTGGTQNTAELQRLNIIRRKMSTEGTLSDRLDCLQTSIRSLHNRMGAFVSSQKIPSTQPSGMTEISQIKYELGCLVHDTQKLAQICQSLETERKEMKMQLALLISKQPRARAPPPPPQRADRTRNSGLATRKSELAIRLSRMAARKSELATLTEKQIMELLDVLGMMKYHEMFAEQSIDGEVLVECDEPTLQHELGMDSKVDRIRLMKIISGQYSALGVLRREYPYVPV